MIAICSSASASASSASRRYLSYSSYSVDGVCTVVRRLELFEVVWFKRTEVVYVLSPSMATGGGG